MKKKIIGSSILLVVLLLGLSTISFANDISLAQFKNYVVNVGIKEGLNESNVITYIDSSSAFSSFVNATSEVFENPNIDLYFLNTGFNIWFYYFPHNTTNKIVVRNKNDVDITISGSFTGYQLVINNASIFRTTTSTYYNNTKNSYYYSDLIMFDDWGSTVWKSPPVYWTSSDIFDGPYEDIAPFSFIPETGLGIVSYNNYDYNLYEAPSSGDLLLGTLNIPNGIVVNYQDIINHYWRWNNWQERSLPSDFIKLRLLSSEEGNLSWAVYLTNDNIYNNTYYQYIWTSTQTEPYQFVSGGCYIKDSHTVIVDGIVDPYLTFSGDYSDEYNNNLELQDLKDTMQDQTDQLLDSSEVDSLLGKFGSSGDILEQFGYSPIENPFVVVIRNVFIGLNDVLLGSGNQTLDLSSFGMELVLHSDDFILPDNIIFNFIHLICNGFFVYGLYKYGFQLIQWINTGRLQNLLDETTGHTHYLF